MSVEIHTPITEEVVASLLVGDTVSITGYILCGRDAVLPKLLKMVKEGKAWEFDELQKSIWKNKYRHNGESFDEWIKRISNNSSRISKLIRQKRFLFAGRILANRGLQKEGKKVTYSNCYVIEPPKDSIEDIFDTAKKLARTFSYGGGAGNDI